MPPISTAAPAILKGGVVGRLDSAACAGRRTVPSVSRTLPEAAQGRPMTAIRSWTICHRPRLYGDRWRRFERRHRRPVAPAASASCVGLVIKRHCAPGTAMGQGRAGAMRNIGLLPDVSRRPTHAGVKNLTEVGVPTTRAGDLAPGTGRAASAWVLDHASTEPGRDLNCGPIRRDFSGNRRRRSRETLPTLQGVGSCAWTPFAFHVEVRRAPLVRPGPHDPERCVPPHHRPAVITPEAIVSPEMLPCWARANMT